MLLDHGVNVDTKNIQGETALHLLSRGYFHTQQGVETARLLLERGVEVNARRKDGLTSLHLAAFKGRVEVAQVLFDHGANVKLENEKGETALHLVSRGEYNSQEQGASTARLLLGRGVEVNAQSNKDCWTSLHWAAFKGRVEVAQILLDHGANTKLETEGGETALHIVSRGEYDSQEQGASTAKLLLEHGVDVNVREKEDGWTSLHEAAFNGRVEVARVLLDHGANVKLVTEGGETALHIVSRGEYDSEEHGVGIARLLLEHDVDVHVQDKYFVTALHDAAFNGRLEITQLLLSHGANPKAETEQGRTPLHQVSRGEHKSPEYGVGIVRLLLEHGVDVNVRDKEDGRTSLHDAAFKGRVDVTRVLLDHGANVKLETKAGETALHIVSQGEYDLEEHGAGIACLLLEHGVDVHVQDKYFATALHDAAFNGRLEITQLLLSHGANPKAETAQGRTPLHQVSRGEYKSPEYGVGIVRLLLEHGVDVNVRDKEDGWTSLHDAVFKGRVDVTQVLLDHGANVKLETKADETALHILSRGKYDCEEHGVGIARLLLEHGVDVHVQDKFFNTALHWAAIGGRLEITRLLLDRGSNPNVENEKGRIPLHSVLRGKQQSQEHGAGIARLLLDRGVDVNAQEKNNWTLLHSAVFNGRLDITQVLSFFHLFLNPLIFRDYRYFLIVVRKQMRRTMRARSRYT